MSDSATSSVSGLISDPATPRWAKDIFRFLPVKSQFILHNNIRDRYPFPMTASEGAEPTTHYQPLDLTSYLSEALALRGYEYFIRYNSIQGFHAIPIRSGEDPKGRNARAFFSQHFEMKFNVQDNYSCSLEKSLELIEKMVHWRGNFIAIFADFASRYVVRPDGLNDREHEYFTKAMMLSHSASPHVTPELPEAQFNTLFWFCDKENDLPGWFALDNPRIREVTVPKPDHIIRRVLVNALMRSLPGYDEAEEVLQKQQAEVFVDQTQGMVLTDILAISQLCRKEGLPFSEVGEAVRRYKLGVTEDPWKRLDRSRIKGGENFIHTRVKGQNPAVVKSMDIIKRAVTGLSGSEGGRPRGVMFLAGPTGVGKTELAKTLTELLFGDERAYIRFDMSEFSAEHASQRLLGAPPGYTGYNAGGELTNAIKEKPFSVVLFDEIEKSHPRLLDKFLQLLDDGVLTSGRGERVYFSESVIVFTSNLGIYRTDADGNRVLNVTPDDPYESVEKNVRREIDHYFKNQLNRPEILNRIGENIVVFDFIRPEVAQEIYRKMVSAVLDRLADKQKIFVLISDEIDHQLMGVCTSDLSNGGRGIRNHLEAWLVNPLARALFDHDVVEGTTVQLTALREDNGVPCIDLQVQG